MSKLLITRPEHDITTRYLAKWSEEIIKEAQAKGMGVIDLHRTKANRERVIGVMEKISPRLVVLNGHGSKNSVAGHEDEVILESSDKKAVKSKIIFARSCQSAQGLGQKSIANGANAYLGYKEDFLLAYNPSKISRPLEDKTAKLFLEPSNAVAVSLLKNHSTGYADKKAKDLFRRNVKNLLVKGPSGDDYFTVKYLLWDMTHQVCLGDMDAIL